MRQPLKLALCGALICVVCSYVAAALCAAIFRFPIPFGGYARGIEAVWLSPLAVTFYGVLGGFALQAAVGAGVAVWASRKRRQCGGRAWPACLWAAAAALPGVLLLATLDWFIGPW